MRSPLHVAIATIAASHAAVAPGADAPDGVYLVTMNALDVPIVEGDRADGRLRIKIVLRAADATGAARLQDALPALRETSLATTSEFARLHASPFSPVDAGRLAADLQTALHQRNAALESVLLVEVAAIRA